MRRSSIAFALLLTLATAGYLRAQIGPSALMMLPGIVDANYALKVTGVAADFSSQVGPGAIANLPGKVDANNALLVTMSGGTMSGPLLFSPDNTFDIGASGANRPRNVFVGTQLFLGASQSRIIGQADGVIQLGNNSNNDFSRLQFGGATSTFPALKRNGTVLETKLADDSAYTNFRASSFIATGSFTSAVTTGTVVTNSGQTVANDATISLGTSAVLGTVTITATEDNQLCVFALPGAGATTFEFEDPGNICSAVATTVNSINVYWDAVDARYELENKRGANRTIRVIRLGV